MIKQDDIKKVISAMRSARRSEEIRLYGKPLYFFNVVKSKKVYSRTVKHKNNDL